jgi:hypothetical protein
MEEWRCLEAVDVRAEVVMHTITLSPPQVSIKDSQHPRISVLPLLHLLYIIQDP